MRVASAPRGQLAISNAIQLMLRVIAVTILLWAFASVLLATARGDFSDALRATPGSILLAATIYALGQIMRVVRLALLIGDARLSIRHVANLHFFTAGVALGTPLRLGDAYRATELGRTTGGLIIGFTYVWIERLLDAAVILPLLLYAASRRGDEASTYLGITAFTLLFVSFSVLLVALLPDNLRRVGTYLIRRHEGQWSIRALRLMDDVRAVIRRIPVMLRGKIASLTALTLLVWLFELGSFTVVTLSWNPGSDPLGGLLAFLSQTTGGGILPDLLARAPNLNPAELAYLSGSQAPLALVALAAAVQYLRVSHRRKS